MASKFFKATNTGVGFITREDRLRFTISGVVADIYEVSGDFQEWVSRVGGVEVFKAEVDALIAEIEATAPQPLEI
jgi:hypothetical protein